MTTTRAPDKKGTTGSTVRNRYFDLGLDAEAGTHVYRTVDETIFAFDDRGRRVHRFDIDDDRTVEHYIAHVGDAVGWADCRFGFDAYADRVAEVCGE